MNRRDLLKSMAMATAGVAVTSIPVQAETGPFPSGVVYTEADPGMWAGKVATHAPKVTLKGGRLTIETQEHPMVEEHFIVRHTLVDADGKVLGYQTFFPGDKSKSVYADPGKGTFYATSYCNQHDYWVTKVEL